SKFLLELTTCCFHFDESVESLTKLSTTADYCHLEMLLQTASPPRSHIRKEYDYPEGRTCLQHKIDDHTFDRQNTRGGSCYSLPASPSRRQGSSSYTQSRYLLIQRACLYERKNTTK